MIERMRRKLTEDDGGIYLFACIMVLVIVMVTSVILEYLKIMRLLNIVDDSYKRAMITVATENYDNLFSTTREEDIVPGEFEGGNAGDHGNEEKPVYFSEEDLGDIEEEMEDLLGLSRSETILQRSGEDKGSIYSLSDFQIEALKKGGSGENILDMKGTCKISIPIYFLGKQVTELELDVKSKASWKTKW